MSVIIKKVRDIPHQPCCGYFLHGGTRVVGLIDFGLSLFAMILIGSEIYQRIDQLAELKQKGDLFHYYFRAASWGSYFTFKVLILSLSVLLFRAAKRRSARLCKLWMIFSVIINICMFAVFYVNHYLFDISLTVHVFGFFYIIYKLYCLHVVWSFVKEIESYGGFNAALSGLTDAEVEEFEKGCPPDREVKDSGFTIQNQAFNKDFEITPENLEIDKSSILGSGAFGCVYRGKLGTESGSKSVAVKTVNPNADVAYFKTLLAELKVMTFLGQNENVVNLIGACTASIKEKQLYVVVEFCPYGNLHDYLKARRGLFVNFVKDGEIGSAFKSTGKFIYSNVHSGNSITTVDIFKWVYETSKGLEFLEEMKVVHGDIAARNILLGFGKVAKISDFGLSKKLYQYTTIKKEECLLPWRWMAIESLIDMEFSTKSDVWSFATTIWEALSLSELPFPGFNWDQDFIHKMRDGLRMKQPKNATNEIYELMIKCWQPDPLERPTFQEVRVTLEQMLNEVKTVVGIGSNCDSSPNEMDTTYSNMPQPCEDDIEVYIPNAAMLSVSESEL